MVVFRISSSSVESSAREILANSSDIDMSGIGCGVSPKASTNSGQFGIRCLR